MNEITFAYVTGKEADGQDGTTFAVNEPLAAGGYGGIFVNFQFDPSVPLKTREALYLPVLSSLNYH